MKMTADYDRWVLTLQDMSEIVGVPVAQLRLWLVSGKIKAATTYESPQMIGSEKVYVFSEDDIELVRRLAKSATTPKQPREKEKFMGRRNRGR